MRRSRIRPDPVSCQSCRSKKLRCSRVQPCGNCTARGISCNFLVPPRSEPSASISTTPNYPDSGILARIERLEALVISRSAPGHDFSRETALAKPDAAEVVAFGVHQKQDTDFQALENLGLRQDTLVQYLDFIFYLKYPRTAEVNLNQAVVTVSEQLRIQNM